MTDDLKAGAEPTLIQRLRGVHRYTITSEGASLGDFRLVEDPEGAWVTWAEVDAASREASEAIPASSAPVLREQEPPRCSICKGETFTRVLDDDGTVTPFETCDQC